MNNTIIHGHARLNRVSPTYKIWLGMRDRCVRKSYRYYHRYGGRGIKVCKRWNSFINFLNDMGERPIGMSIDRINNDGDYKPSNCRWASIAEQSRNSMQTRFITLNEERMCLKDWAIKTGISEATIRTRINKGWSVRDSLTTPTRKFKSIAAAAK